MNFLFFLPFGSSTPCRTNLPFWRFFYWHTCPLTLCGHTHINNWLVPFNHGNINSNFWFGNFLFLFCCFLPHRTINCYMSFSTTKTPHSIMTKSIILIITMLVISIIQILLTIALLVLTIWSWIILSISKLIIWCVILM